MIMSIQYAQEVHMPVNIDGLESLMLTTGKYKHFQVKRSTFLTYQLKICYISWSFTALLHCVLF